MHQNNDSQNEIIVIETAVWAFWAFFFAVAYLLA